MSPFGWYLAALGGLNLVGGLVMLGRRLRLHHGGRAEGVITGYQPRLRTRNRPPPQMPVVEFHCHAGVQRFQSRMSADPARWPVGTRVRVAYSRARPERAEIASAARLWLSPLVIILFGMALLSTALLRVG